MPYLGELSALLTSFLWSGTSFAFTAASKRIGSLQLNINRMIFAAILLFTTITILNFNLNLNSTQILFLVLSGIAGLVLGDSFLFKAFQYIGARIGMLLMALVPAISTFEAYIFLGESLSLISFTGITVTISGILLVILERGKAETSLLKASRTGILLGILGATGQASGLILAKVAFQAGELNGMVATFFRIISSVIILFPVGLISRRYKNPVKLFKNDPKALGATLTGTFLGPYLGITFSLIAISNAPVGIASTLMSLMPVIMLPMARFIFKERLTWRAILGAVIAVAGVAILFLR